MKINGKVVDKKQQVKANQYIKADSEDIKRAQIIEAINDMDDSDLYSLYNEFCDANNDYDGRIYTMDEFDELMDGLSPTDIALRIFYGDFNPRMDYWKYDGYGNLQSYYDIKHADCIYPDEIADLILRQDDALYNDEIQAILDGDYDEDEDEE